MVGRLIVGDPAADPWIDDPRRRATCPRRRWRAFPSVAAIMDRGVVPGRGWA